jgi:hypothetical protein
MCGEKKQMKNKKNKDKVVVAVVVVEVCALVQGYGSQGYKVAGLQGNLSK